MPRSTRPTIRPFRLLPLAFLFSAIVVPGAAQAQMAGHGATGDDADAEAIREVIQSAYVSGLHMNGSREDIRAGFHPDFVMTVLRNGETGKVAIEDWIGGLPPEGTAVDRVVTAEIPMVDRNGDTAVARIEVTIDGKHTYTDYMGLYRFPEGWRIVNKIFQAH